MSKRVTAATTAESATETAVGVDTGTTNLAVAAPAHGGPTVDDAVIAGGEVETALFSELAATLRRLRETDGDTYQRERQVTREYRDALRRRFAVAVVDILAYVRTFSDPVLVLEDLPHQYEPLEDIDPVETNENWVMPAFQRELAMQASREGLRVTYVSPESTTSECHICGEKGERVENSRDLGCTTPGCPVGRVDRDRSAAVSIAKRY